jgi:hypothetical protein
VRSGALTVDDVDSLDKSALRSALIALGAPSAGKLQARGMLCRARRCHAVWVSLRLLGCTCAPPDARALHVWHMCAGLARPAARGAGERAKAVRLLLQCCVLRVLELCSCAALARRSVHALHGGCRFAWLLRVAVAASVLEGSA